MNRRLITYVLLCTSLLVVILAQISFRRPAMWRWLQPAPASSAPVSEQGAQIADNPRETKPESVRRAPYAHLKALAGAADREPFLAPSNDALPELQASAKALLDAQARYHLLELAKDAVPAAIESDARTDIRYQALLQKPSEYRGELVRIQGDLISLSDPMELQGKLPGIEVCYVALMTHEQPNHQFLVLFTDLPAELLKQKPQWGQLYLRQVQFSGYFYKVARFVHPRNKDKSWLMPVLVGKSPILPEVIADSNDWLNLAMIFACMALPVILIALFLPRYFKKTDAQHDSLMKRFKARREEQVAQSLEELPRNDDPDLRFRHDVG